MEGFGRSVSKLIILHYEDQPLAISIIACVHAF